MTPLPCRKQHGLLICLCSRQNLGGFCLATKQKRLVRKTTPVWGALRTHPGKLEKKRRTKSNLPRNNPLPPIRLSARLQRAAARHVMRCSLAQRTPFWWLKQTTGNNNDFSVAVCSPAKSLIFRGLMENPFIGKKIKS